MVKIMAGIHVEKDNTDQVLKALAQAKQRALKIIGMNAEKYAKALCPVGTVESTGQKGYRGGTLRNSITHVVDEDTVTIGSNVEYAPYVELGTGPHFQAPPSWETFDVPTPKGKGNSYVYPRPYLKPAILDHVPEYEHIIEEELKG